MRYTRVADVVEAFRYEGQDLSDERQIEDVPIWVVEAYQDGTLYYYSVEEDQNAELFLRAYDGNLYHVTEGSYIVRNQRLTVCNGLYMMPANLFEKQFEAVEAR